MRSVDVLVPKMPDQWPSACPQTSFAVPTWARQRGTWAVTRFQTVSGGFPWSNESHLVVLRLCSNRRALYRTGQRAGLAREVATIPVRAAVIGPNPPLSNRCGPADRGSGRLPHECDLAGLGVNPASRSDRVALCGIRRCHYGRGRPPIPDFALPAERSGRSEDWWRGCLRRGPETLAIRDQFPK